MNQVRRGTFRTVLLSFAAMLIGLVVAMLGAEGGVRLVAGRLGLSAYMMYDPVLGWTAKPGAKKIHKSANPTFAVTYVINRQGFRGATYDTAKADGVVRIVVLGDSNGFGWGLLEEETFASILDHELKNVEVINLSLSGYGTDQSYLRFVEEGLKYRPDIVILQVTPNDFDEIQFAFFNQKAKPRFVLNVDGGLRLTNVPVLSTGREAEEFYGNSLPLPFKEWLGWNSYCYNFLNEKYYAARRQYGYRRHAEHQQFSESSIALFNAIVARLAEKLNEIGARGIIVHTSKELGQEGSLQEGGFIVLDLYSRFLQEAASDPAPLFFPDGYHYTARGNRVIADELIAVIK